MGIMGLDFLMRICVNPDICYNDPTQGQRSYNPEMTPAELCYEIIGEMHIKGHGLMISLRREDLSLEKLCRTQVRGKE